MANEEQKQESKESLQFKESLLSKEEQVLFRFAKTRIGELKETRKNHYGMNLDVLFAEADKDYIPHRLSTKGMKVIATDEDKGWRGSVVELGSSNWQSDVSQSNPFIKISTALSILVDQNPQGVFTPTQKKYQATTALIQQLYQRSWEYAKSRGQLKLFVHNLAKYGWAVGRTYPLKLDNKVKVLKEFNQDDPDASVYEEKTVCEYNDIFRENLDPRNVWIDDMAKPNNIWSVRDWTWRKVYDIDELEREFGNYKLWEYVHEGGETGETISENNKAQKEFQSKRLVEVYFYENKSKDLFCVLANGVPLVITPLPISDGKGNKKLSCWQTFWNIRHAESPYGIGIYEAIRYNQSLLDRVRNMTIDQLTLSIYKMFFYQGTQNMEDTGQIQITPGVGKQTLDPKNINWLDIPGPGKDAYEGIAALRKDIDEDSGITDPLLGQVTGKTAFEIAQAKESALKRLKNPFDNILEALNEEGYITVSLIQLLYSIPEVVKISNPDLIDEYLKETAADPDLYERKDTQKEDGTIDSSFEAKIYPEFPLNLDKDEKGNLIETQDTQFFRVKPQYLQWEGIINIKSQSVLSPSKQVDKALDLEFYDRFNQLLSLLEQERVMAMQAKLPSTLDDLPHGKSAKTLVKLYDKDPKDVFPDQWLVKPPEPDQAQEMMDNPLIVDQNKQRMEQQAMANGMTPPPQQQPTAQPQEAPLFVSSPVSIPKNPQGIVNQVSQKISQPFRKV